MDQNILTNALLVHHNLRPSFLIQPIDYGEFFEKRDVKITQSQSSKAVNRILTTNYQEFNNDMWGNAGYNIPLTISEMVKEYALWA